MSGAERRGERRRGEARGGAMWASRRCGRHGGRRGYPRAARRILLPPSRLANGRWSYSIAALYTLYGESQLMKYAKRSLNDAR